MARDLPQNDFYSSPIGKPLYLSIIFHVIIFVIATVGFPLFVRDIIPPDDIVMNVDFLEVSEENTSPEPPSKAQKTETPNEDPKPLDDPTYNNTNAVPDLTRPKEPEKPTEKAKEPEADPTEIIAPPKPLSKPKPPQTKPEPKVEPPKPEALKPVEQAKEEPTRDITSLLKSLTPEQEQSSQDMTTDVTDTNVKPSPVANFSSELSMSELSALNAGVSPCWNVNAGGKYAEDLVVSLRVFVNPDLTVQRVDIIDNGGRFDTHKRAAAETARRALLNPQCNKLNLPLEKYEYWKEFIYTFDPSDML